MASNYYKRYQYLRDLDQIAEDVLCENRQLTDEERESFAIELLHFGEYGSLNSIHEMNDETLVSEFRSAGYAYVDLL